MHPPLTRCTPIARYVSPLMFGALVFCWVGCAYLPAGTLDERLDMDGDGVPRPTDCDDSDASVRVNAYYADSDQDGFGSEVMTRGCVLEEGYAERSGDCDDSDADINPLGSEVCDGADNDCDGLVDDDDEDAPLFVWYRDEDGDGAGDQEVSTEACAPPVGYVTGDVVDCDDTAATTHPGAPELCDGVDNDCDDTTSEDGVVTLDAAVNFSTIQEAVGAASEGSTVLVCDGTFTETLVFPDSMTLQSLNGPDVTTLDGGGFSATVQVFTPVEVVVSGFTITGGSGYATSGTTAGGGVFGAGGASISIDACVIVGNQAAFGGGLFLITDLYHEGGDQQTTTLAVSDTVVTGNSADNGGGLFVEKSAVTFDSSSEVIENEAGSSGGGISLFNGCTLSGGLVLGNLALQGGGGGVSGGDSTIVGTTFEQNLAQLGGGVVVANPTEPGSSTRLEFHDVSIKDNSATTYGGGLISTGSAASLSDSVVSGNTAVLGGGIFIHQSDVEVEASTIERNVASSYGGGVLMNNGTLVSASSSWGDGPDDNSPDDVAVERSSGGHSTHSGYGSSESFTCDSGGCR